MTKYTASDRQYWLNLRNKIEVQVLEETDCEVGSFELDNEVDVEFLYRFGFDYADVLDEGTCVKRHLQNDVLFISEHL